MGVSDIKIYIRQIYEGCVRLSGVSSVVFGVFILEGWLLYDVPSWFAPFCIGVGFVAMWGRLAYEFSGACFKFWQWLLKIWGIGGGTLAERIKNIEIEDSALGGSD